MSGFLAMGGYGAYVWPSYAVAALALGGLLAVSLAQRAAARRELAARGLDRRKRGGGDA
ncbi:MAG: heme exporter protein CcmD [Rhodospirillales bacterium]|nr:heme exporter protein CcmD [Rhodospirillales bacterium]QQS14874.1 MAG: heme exporter protein CcmD [Rhodospirillales bacterium]